MATPPKRTAIKDADTTRTGTTTRADARRQQRREETTRKLEAERKLPKPRPTRQGISKPAGVKREKRSTGGTRKEKSGRKPKPGACGSYERLGKRRGTGLDPKTGKYRCTVYTSQVAARKRRKRGVPPTRPWFQKGRRYKKGSDGVYREVSV